MIVVAAADGVGEPAAHVEAEAGRKPPALFDIKLQQRLERRHCRGGELSLRFAPIAKACRATL